jgi:hypothetical protein
MRKRKMKRRKQSMMQIAIECSGLEAAFVG